MKLTARIVKFITKRRKADEWESLSYPEQRLLEAKVRTEGLPSSRCLRFLRTYLTIGDLSFHRLEGRLMCLEVIDGEGNPTSKGRKMLSNR